MSNQLLPCPFCNGEAKLWSYRLHKNGQLVEMWWAACTWCGVDSHADTFTPESATAAWNQRDSVPVDDIEYIIARYFFQVERGQNEHLDRINAWLDKVKPIDEGKS